VQTHTLINKQTDMENEQSKEQPAMCKVWLAGKNNFTVIQLKLPYN